MVIDIYSQVKDIVSVVLTVIIAVSAGFVSQNPILWLLIITGGVIQVILICIPSVEERFYRKRMEHMERTEKMDMEHEERCKEFKLSKKFQQMQDRAKEIKEQKDIKGFIDFIKTGEIKKR